MFPDDAERKVIGLVAVLAIQCIWFARLDKTAPEARRFESALKNHVIDKYLSIINGSQDKWHTEWDGLHGMGGRVTDDTFYHDACAHKFSHTCAPTHICMHIQTQ